ncbi:MAG: hypothetical protein AAF525_10605 [Pseudomonadota bacterium]
MSDQVFLQYGLDPDSHEGDATDQTLKLVSIEEVESGRGTLVCPYCNAPLIARKGHVNQHHFAHDGDTCRESKSSLAMSIPLYDEIATLPGLLASDLRMLTHTLRRDQLNESQFRGPYREAFDRLVDAELIESVPEGQRWINNVGSHVYTKVGKQYASAGKNRLSLSSFDKLQQDAIGRKLLWLKTLAPLGGSSLVDYQLYLSHLDRLMQQSLYFLDVGIQETPRSKLRSLNKIGMTHRAIDERLAEIRTELGRYCHKATVEVLDVLPNKGRVELYFKRKYRKRQHRIGPLTEYFEFGQRSPVDALRTLKKVKLTPELAELSSSLGSE